MSATPTTRPSRRFLPNLVNVTLISEALGQNVRLRISANALRSVEHRGGLDAFLAKADEAELSQRARLLKKQIAKKIAEQPARLIFSIRAGAAGPAHHRARSIPAHPRRWFHYPG